jgi:hypothetical protein
MLNELKELEARLPELLAQPGIWNSLLIDYYPPKVERLWTQLGEQRLMLHVIHPCAQDEALWHPHPWPSAIKILSGRYEMGCGYGRGIKTPPTSHTLILAAGSSYEMLHRDGWHYVRPLDAPSHSLMLIGKPWKRKRAMPSAPDSPLNPLQIARAAAILAEFRQLVGA